MANQKVVFYGAGENAEIKHNFTLKRIGSREPVAFCDRDPHKQGKQFLGLPIMSFADAKEQFGDFDICVVANPRNAPSIIEYLLENGVKPENIINYEPIEKRKGCTPAESVLQVLFSGDHLEFYPCCCGADLGHFMDRPKFTLPDTTLNNEIFSSVLSAQKTLQNNIKHGCPPPLCDHCLWHKDDAYHYVNFKLREIKIGGHAPCNFSCYNCGNIIQWDKTYNAWDILLDRFKVIEDSGIVADDSLVALSLGEHTVAAAHGEILRYLSKYPLIVFSNAYVWSEPTAEALASGNMWLRVSVDAGTRETFAKVKGVDGFDRVCENLERYAYHGTLILKYILFPGQNDDDANLSGFVELVERLNAKINLARDFAGEVEDCTSLSEETLMKFAEIIIRFQNKGKFYGIECRPNERARLQEILNGRGAPPLPSLL